MPKKIHIHAREFFDESTQQFITVPELDVTLEHSLLSISKWEAKTHKPFLVDEPQKTSEEMYYYMWCMSLDENVEPISFRALTESQIKEIVEYIQDPQTATTINHKNKKKNREIVTSELIYYWMCANYIPYSCETWPLNRLLTLIEVCSIKNDPKQGKMKTRDILSQNAALNKARRAKLGTTG